MARIKIELPEKFIFSTELRVRITDLNYGGHLGNDAILRIAHEARVRFLNELGYSESDIEGSGIIMSDAAIMYKSEAFYADVIRIQIAVQDFSKRGCDIFYLMTRKGSESEIARLKTGIVFFDYDKRKTVAVPVRFKEKVR